MTLDKMVMVMFYMDYMNRLKFYMDYTYVSTPISPHEIGGDVIFGA